MYIYIYTYLTYISMGKPPCLFCQFISLFMSASKGQRFHGNKSGISQPVSLDYQSKMIGNFRVEAWKIMASRLNYFQTVGVDHKIGFDKYNVIGDNNQGLFPINMINNGDDNLITGS